MSHLSGSSSSREAIFKIVLGLAAVVLLHAAYSVAEWRSLTRKTTSVETESGPDDTRSGDGTESSSLPLDITLQTIVGFVLAMVSVVNIAGDFKEIRAGIELGKRTWEHARNRPSFYVYNHRGKAFSPDYAGPPDSKKSNLDIPNRFLS